MTHVGGKAIRCRRCLRITTTHSTYTPITAWCLWCQRLTSRDSWIFVVEDDGSPPDYERRGCAAEGPATLDMPVGKKRFLLPMCALDEGHEGQHEDTITRSRW